MSSSLKDRLVSLGFPSSKAEKFESRKQDSLERLNEIVKRLGQQTSVKAYPNFTIYATGSYARGEASIHSDIDLFFIHENTDGETVDDPHMKEIRLMSSVIGVVEEDMKFPPLSNDGQFLKIIPLSEILEHLGGAEDDYRNHFTARMLLLLESRPVYGEKFYDMAIEKIIDSYMRDYEDHAEDFRPTFLVNDIIRFWKTLCLNYEHRRNQDSEARKIKQKIRNFKLGYSRLLTCMGTVALLSSFNNISKDELIPLCKMSPLERLVTLCEKSSTISEPLESALSRYHWFLEKTELSTEELERYFSDRENRVVAFKNAKNFGDDIYEIIRITAEETGTLRYLVV